MPTQRLIDGVLWIAVQLHRDAQDAAKLARLAALGAAQGIALVATGDVHMHVRARRALQDVMTAIRGRCTLSEAGHRLFVHLWLSYSPGIYLHSIVWAISFLY